MQRTILSYVNFLSCHYNVMMRWHCKLLSFSHLYLLFYGRGYRTVAAMLLLVRVMIIISYRSPTITISPSLSMWSQFAMQASTWCIPRNEEHISSYSKFSTKIFKFSLPWQQGENFAYTQIRRRRKLPDWCKTQEHISHRSPVIVNFLLVGAIIGDVSSIQAEL